MNFEKEEKSVEKVAGLSVCPDCDGDPWKCSDDGGILHDRM
jgi:hypothetical protein